jgi:ABC-2 type transport system ATP-binding protein
MPSTVASHAASAAASPGNPPGRTSNAIEADGLVKVYPVRGRREAVRALDGLSIAVPRGSVFGLLGPNGAGKSTTIKILTTLARPTQGTAVVQGLDVLRQPEQVRRVIGVVAQHSGSDPMATGRENLILQGHLFGMGGEAVKARADELLERFDLGGAAGRLVKTYSGGMQRRLDVALGLVHRPQILFLDEPTAGLDPEARTAMWHEIARLAGGEGMTVLLTTHYMEEADRLADRLAIVDHGRVVAEGSPDELKGDLRGDAVHLELASGSVPAHARDALHRLPGVRDLRVSGRSISARSDDGAAAVPGILAALDRAGAPAASVTVARPSLDDVYLRHTGHRYSSDQADLEANPS